MQKSNVERPRVVADSSKLSQVTSSVAGMPTPEGESASEPSRYPEILTTALAAELLHVHVEYLRRMVRENRIPAHRFPGGREIRFHRDELIAWVLAQPGEDRSPSAAEKDRS
jgi:excisionase family DNA binding protein